MFGFLPGAPACCQKSAAVYRAHFCGLGTSLHKRHGAWARWLVNRDSTLLTLLGSALAPCAPPTRLATCCNRFTMPRLLLDDSPVMQYVSAVTVCGLSAKLDDEIEDEAGWRRRAARLLSRCLDEPVSDALGLLHGMGFPVQQVRAHLAGQKSVEIQGQDLARCARPTSAAYGEIVSHLAYVAGVPQARDGLREIGESLGFLVYARDAWDDWARDKRRGQFNPLQAFPQLMGRREAVLPSMRAAARSSGWPRWRMAVVLSQGRAPAWKKPKTGPSNSGQAAGTDAVIAGTAVTSSSAASRAKAAPTWIAIHAMATAAAAAGVTAHDTRWNPGAHAMFPRIPPRLRFASSARLHHGGSVASARHDA